MSSGYLHHPLALASLVPRPVMVISDQVRAEVEQIRREIAASVRIVLGLLLKKDGVTRLVLCRCLRGNDILAALDIDLLGVGEVAQRAQAWQRVQVQAEVL